MYIHLSTRELHLKYMNITANDSWKTGNYKRLEYYHYSKLEQRGAFGKCWLLTTWVSEQIEPNSAEL
jgi:hypothetical protein